MCKWFYGPRKYSIIMIVRVFANNKDTATLTGIHNSCEKNTHDFTEFHISPSPRTLFSDLSPQFLHVHVDVQGEAV